MQATIQQPTLSDARSALAAGRAAEAEAACLALLKAGTNPGAAHLLALLRYQTGRPEEAVRLLERALDAEPGLVAAANDLGAMLIALNRPVEAAARLRQALAREPANVEVAVNYANALHAQGELSAAEDAYRAALARDPRHPRGNLSLGNLLVQMRRPAEALQALDVAVAVAPGSAVAHCSRGNALRDSGDAEAAMDSYRHALRIDPDNADACEALGVMLKARGDLAAALECFRRASAKPLARAQGLECLLRLGRHEEFFGDITASREAEAVNLHSASLSAYAAWHLGRPDPHPFCPDPLSHVRVVDRYVRPGADADFLRDLVAEASQLNAVWEPRGVTTKKGFQTGGNLFAHGLPALGRLRDDLLAEFARYRSDLRPASMALATRWPMNMRLHGWFVRLLTGGHQYFHNHPFGWMSGCLYLQMPKASPAGEGAIEFGLESGDYPRLSERPSPTLLIQPRPGQVAFFPSSLYHRTIPFSSAEERLCIAFDLQPG